VMRIRRHAAAHQARLPHHELPVLFIAQANRLAQGTHWTSACPLRRGSQSVLTTGGIGQPAVPLWSGTPPESALEVADGPTGSRPSRILLSLA
jgi:hypothetical protein